MTIIVSVKKLTMSRSFVSIMTFLFSILAWTINLTNSQGNLLTFQSMYRYNFSCDLSIKQNHKFSEHFSIFIHVHKVFIYFLIIFLFSLLIFFFFCHQKHSATTILMLNVVKSQDSIASKFIKSFIVVNDGTKKKKKP